MNPKAFEVDLNDLTVDEMFDVLLETETACGLAAKLGRAIMRHSDGFEWAFKIQLEQLAVGIFEACEKASE